MDHKIPPQERTDMPGGVIPWRDIWSAGQSAGLIGQVMPLADLVDRLTEEFEATYLAKDWRARLAEL